MKIFNRKQFKMAFIQNISFDALSGPDDSTWEWQEEIGKKLQVEAAVEELVNSVVEESMANLPVARVLFSEHEEDTESSDISVYDGVVGECVVCSQSEWTVMERIVKVDGTPVDSLREYQGRIVCGCCEEMLRSPHDDDTRCTSCFLSEKMAKRYGISMIPRFTEEHVCSVCNDNSLDLTSEISEEYEEAPGIPGEWEQLLDGSWVLNGEIYEDEEYETYTGEYENEEVPENNSEIAKEIKASIYEIGDWVFSNIQDKISEGEYLKVMDLLQKMTNDVNRL